MKSPLFSGLIYIVLGCVFTFFAVQQVSTSGWGIFAYVLLILAAFDLGTGLRMIALHFKMKNEQK